MVMAAAAPANALASDRCGTYPDQLYDKTLYGPWSDCDLKAIGEPPLWKGLPAGTLSTIRFVFTQGHGLFFRVVTIDEHGDGSGTMRVAGQERRDRMQVAPRRMATRHVRLSVDDMRKIKALGDQSGVWEFDVGTWDRTDDDSLFMHCQLLGMERADADGYRYSEVNIGCNKPSKLMPFVDEVVRLANLNTDESGMLYY